ncbi:hypothetical protein, partial [Photobacterium swingsii]|uniref:hypothetical protein n=1 Tax=Photobacterium swingsii TaxID=680026 RepID=UPI003D137720
IAANAKNRSQRQDVLSKMISQKDNCEVIMSDNKKPAPPPPQAPSQPPTRLIKDSVPKSQKK